MHIRANDCVKGFSFNALLCLHFAGSSLFQYICIPQGNYDSKDLETYIYQENHHYSSTEIKLLNYYDFVFRVGIFTIVLLY